MDNPETCRREADGGHETEIRQVPRHRQPRRDNHGTARNQPEGPPAALLFQGPDLAANLIGTHARLHFGLRLPDVPQIRSARFIRHGDLVPEIAA